MGFPPVSIGYYSCHAYAKHGIDIEDLVNLIGAFNDVLLNARQGKQPWAELPRFIEKNPALAGDYISQALYYAVEGSQWDIANKIFDVRQELPRAQIHDSFYTADKVYASARKHSTPENLPSVQFIERLEKKYPQLEKNSRAQQIFHQVKG